MNWNEHPYQDIEVVDLYTEDRMHSQGKSVRVMNPQSSEFEEVKVVSPNYLLIPNRVMKEMTEEIIGMASNINFNIVKEFCDGRRYQCAYEVENVEAEFKPGNTIKLGVMCKNSYDTSWAPQLSMYALEVKCSNGWTSQRHFSSFRFKHHRSNENWQNDAREIFKATMATGRHQLEKFAGNMNKLGNWSIDSHGMLNEARAKVFPGIPTSIWGEVVDRSFDKEPTMLGLIQASTSLLWNTDKPNKQKLEVNSLIIDRALDIINSNGN